MTTITKEFADATAFAIGALSLKMCLTHLWTQRTRLRTDLIKQPEDAALLNPESELRIFGMLLSATTFAFFGPTLDSPARLLGIVSNSIENEPFFIASCVAIALFKDHLATAELASVIFYYVALRVLHAISYILALQPARGVFYMFALFIQIYFAIILLMH